MRASVLTAGALAAILALTACVAVQCPTTSTDPHALCTEGVPNLRTVEEGRIYRGGQPSAVGWRYLHDVLGVTTVVKLNGSRESDGQGDDAPAASLGMTVRRHPMSPFDDGDPLEVFRGPTAPELAAALHDLTHAQGAVYLHCTHGRDRTGLMAALYRVFVDHWSPRRARQERQALGYRRVLFGLDAAWHEALEDRATQFLLRQAVQP